MITPYRGALPRDTRTSIAVIDSLLRGTGTSAADIFSGQRWPGNSIIPNSQIVLIQASPGIAMPPIGIAPSFSGTIPFTRLPNGGIRLGTVTLLAGPLLQMLDQWHERPLVEAAMVKFALDSTQAADVMAAVAYVWARRMGPRLLPTLSRFDPELEDTAKAIMAYERAHPGTRDLAIHGDYAAQQALLTIVDSVKWGDVDTVNERRISKVSDPALSTSASKARALVGQQTMQVWTAHHLIPFGVMARQPPPFQLAVAASGWLMDSTENLIALPANLATFLSSPNRGVLPYQQGSHPVYDADVTTMITALSVRRSFPFAAALRIMLASIEQVQRSQILSRIYHDRVY